MTISKERFESIICDEAQKVSPDGWLCGPDPVIEFAHALLKRVEAECEVMFYMDHLGDIHIGLYAEAGDTKLITLPLVEGD